MLPQYLPGVQPAGALGACIPPRRYVERRLAAAASNDTVRGLLQAQLSRGAAACSIVIPSHVGTGFGRGLMSAFG